MKRLGLEAVHTSMHNPSLSVRTAFPTDMCELTLAVVVFISFIVRKRGKSHTTVTNLWRLQLYTFGAFAIACIYQRFTGKLGVFDEIAVYHAGALLLWSAAVGMMIQKGDSPLRPQHYVPVKIGTGRKRGIRNIPLATLTPWFVFVGCFIYMVLAWVIFSIDSSCDGGTVRWKIFPWKPPVTINGTDNGSLRVLLYLFVPMASFILVPLVLRTAPCCKRFFSSVCAYVLPIAYLSLWVKEIYGIERSIMMMINDPSLPVLVRSAQSEWNFGQVNSFSLSSVER